MKNGWCQTTIGNEVTFEYGKGLPKRERLNGNYPVYGSNGIIGFHNSYLIDQPSIIVGRKGSIGELHLAEEPFWPIDTTYYVTPPPNIEFKFLYYLLKMLPLTSLDTSTAIPGLNRNDVYKLEIELPPITEQQKIVNKIEELFSVIGHNIDSLKSTKKTLINLRRKILDHAFKGKLTKDFNDSDFNFDIALQNLEESRKNLYLSFKNGRYKQASSKVRKVNSNWLEISLETFGLVETGATPLKGNSGYWNNGTVPWVTSTVVNQQKVTEASELITDKALKETNTKLFPIGTLLIAMYGEGKTRGKFSELMIEAATNQALAGVILSEQAEQYKEFIKLYLYKNYEDLRRLASGGVQPNLNLTMIKEMQIPFPSKKEQIAIVDILNRYLSIIDNALIQIDQILAITNGTKQSILKKAFEGKLV